MAAFVSSKQRAGTANGTVESVSTEQPLRFRMPLQEMGLAKHDGYKQIPTDEDTDAVLKQHDGSFCQSLCVFFGFTLENDGDLHYTWKSIADSSFFHGVSVSAILANAVLIGFETDYPDWECWDRLELGFLVFFTLELIIRITVFGPAAFFCGESKEDDDLIWNSNKSYGANRNMAEHQSDALWNCFDFAIVSLGVVNQCVTEVVMLMPSDGQRHPKAQDTTLLRIVRLARTLRVMRVVRILRFLKQLYLLAYGFIEGALAVFWVAVLTGSVVYLCAVVMVRHYGRMPEGEPHRDFLVANFHCVGRAMWTLFGIIASPDLDTYDSLIFEYPLLVFFIIMFILFGTFGITGLLTGVISESIIDKNTARLEEQRSEREDKRHRLQNLSRKVYDHIDHGHNGSVHKENFMEHKTKILKTLNAAGVTIDAHDFEHMFEVMDYDDSGTIEKEEFVHCVLEVCDEVRPMSIMEVHSQLSQVHTRVMRLQDKLDRMHKDVHREDGAAMEHISHERRPQQTIDVDQTRQLRQLNTDLELNGLRGQSSDKESDEDAASNLAPAPNDVSPSDPKGYSPLLQPQGDATSVASSLGERAGKSMSHRQSPREATVKAMQPDRDSQRRSAKRLAKAARQQIEVLAALQQEICDACEQASNEQPHYVEVLAELGNDMLELSRSNSWAIAAQAIRADVRAAGTRLDG